MLASLRNLLVAEIVRQLRGEEVRQEEDPPEEVQSEDIDINVQGFIEWFFGDIYGCLAESTALNIEFVEQDEDRCVPEQFYSEMMSFSKPFIDKLMPDMLLRPVLLFSSETYSLVFTNFVCLKLIKDDDPDIDFLKVVTFLLVIISLSFENRCYRPLDNIPGVLYLLLKYDLKTKFYEEDRFDDVLLLCDKLKKDEKWYESTIEEILGYVKVFKFMVDTEVAIKINDDPSRPDSSKTRILDVKSKRSMSNNKICPYCETDCILLLQGIWKPKKDSIFPECLQM